MRRLIEGGSIILLPITETDTELVVSWRNNPKVRINFRYNELLTREIHSKWLREVVDVGKAIQYIIQIKETGRSIGSVFFRDINLVSKTAEFGIFIGEDDARGCGYGQEATKLFSNFGKKEIGLKEIRLRVFEDNIYAIRCYKSCGYRQVDDEGEYVKKDGKTYHMIHMVMRTDG